MELDKILVASSAIAGALSVVVVSYLRIFAEEKTARLENRRNLISSWRSAICNYPDFPRGFGDTQEYSSLRLHLRPEVIQRFEAPRAPDIPGGRGADLQRQMLLDEIARIEKQWRLI
jgi:hypothetical protein